MRNGQPHSPKILGHTVLAEESDLRMALQLDKGYDTERKIVSSSRLVPVIKHKDIEEMDKRMDLLSHHPLVPFCPSTN